MTPRWSPFHLRLHRLLLRRPQLLPAGAPLLLAVSGGQDSMAMAALLLDLRRLHGWTLHLWHGNHGWRAEAGQQAAELAAWARQQGLPITAEAANPGEAGSEAEARLWRYGCLERAAQRLGAAHVLTGHTASDRAETLLLHLARGSHRRGLASLRLGRELTADVQLVRPLLGFSRADTAAVCSALGLPVWLDSSNDDRRFSRNRLRAEVMPVLEALHPGASRRLAATAERFAAEEEAGMELLELALGSLTVAEEEEAPGLERRRLVAQAPANQRRLLHHWLSRHTGTSLGSRPLELLVQRLAPGQPPGQLDLASGWQLRWDRRTLRLQRQ
jgi:tRNA(Ile)-lysidine synthase